MISGINEIRRLYIYQLIVLGVRSFFQITHLTIRNHLSQVASKLSPIVSYEDAVEGLVTHGFITGVEDIGCFVTFYNDVKGLVHKCAFFSFLYCC